jgi:hypothetical protein
MEKMHKLMVDCPLSEASYIRSCSTSKQPWDTLVCLYDMRNEVVAYLRKQVEDVCTAENDSVHMYEAREFFASLTDLLLKTGLLPL